MVQEYTVKSAFWEHTCAAYLYELLNIIARKKALRISNVGYSGEHRIHRACRRIYENMENPPKVSELAEECCLSVSRFSHLFREITGKSPVEFTQTIRLERAKELLSTTDLTIREISERLNFYDQNYFSKNFTRYFGMSPTDYRANNTSN
jgi:AraC-like DNA-binding protein